MKAIKRYGFPVVVTTFITTLAFASAELRYDSQHKEESRAPSSLLEQLDLKRDQQRQVIAVLQEGQAEKLRIMQEAQDKIKQLQIQQQEKLSEILGPQAAAKMEELKQEKADRHKQQVE